MEEEDDDDDDNGSEISDEIFEENIVNFDG